MRTIGYFKSREVKDPEARAYAWKYGPQKQKKKDRLASWTKLDGSKPESRQSNLKKVKVTLAPIPSERSNQSGGDKNG